MKVDISRRQRQVMFDSFKEKIDLIIDSGQSDFGIESTQLICLQKK